MAAASSSSSSLTAALVATTNAGTGSTCSDDGQSVSAAVASRPLPSQPFTPRKLATRLQLQMPSRMQPLSPILDPALGYSVARRPRLDFARSCTSLHHSTLAQSAESSPMTPNSYSSPRRTLDSPIVMHNLMNGPSLSFDEVRAGDTGDESDSSSSLDLDDIDMDCLPSAHTHARRSRTTSESAGSTSLLKLRHAARLRGRSRQSSSSASASSTSLASPSPTTPPPSDLRNASQGGGGYFGKPLEEMIAKRRDSLSQAMNDVIFEANRKEQEDKVQMRTFGATLDAIKRPVTRRGSLLPKTKHFQRVKAALLEESFPVDTEVQREAIITRQLREDDEDDMPITPMTPLPPTTAGTAFFVDDPIAMMSRPGELKRRSVSFATQAQRNEGFWNNIESSSPPAFFGMRMNSEGDIVMGSESIANSPVATHFHSPEVKRLKRRRAEDETRFEQPEIFKRRAVSPGVCQSPTYGNSSPIPIGTNNSHGKSGNGSGGGGSSSSGNASKRHSFIQDTHEVLLKMSLGDAGGFGGQL